MVASGEDCYDEWKVKLNEQKQSTDHCHEVVEGDGVGLVLPRFGGEDFSLGRFDALLELWTLQRHEEVIPRNLAEAFVVELQARHNSHSRRVYKCVPYLISIQNGVFGLCFLLWSRATNENVRTDRRRRPNIRGKDPKLISSQRYTLFGDKHKQRDIYFNDPKSHYLIGLEEDGGLITAGEASKSSDMLYSMASSSDKEDELISASASDSRDCKSIFSNGGRTAIGRSSVSTEIGLVVGKGFNAD
ncbi:hypothetical protein AVEN_22917-1 [Araneus ventricosus]|uniref:Uncharacterized protein n=1 Tax=Araneus ventricosus TaxID=182803 RepID=A0A4Y2D6N6_ARAVE|nr:hypothetical protein AVEN_22917-1 [Araneus ventricosus]